jgi:hypothetical protein
MAGKGVDFAEANLDESFFARSELDIHSLRQNFVAAKQFSRDPFRQQKFDTDR